MTDNGGTARLDSISPPRNGLVKLYNIEVEELHNYFVGRPGGAVLVHNGVPGAVGCGVPMPAEPGSGAAGAIQDGVYRGGGWGNALNDGVYRGGAGSGIRLVADHNEAPHYTGPMGINAEILRQPESRDAAEKRKIAEEIRLLQAKELYPSEFRNIRGPNYVPSAEARHTCWAAVPKALSRQAIWSANGSTT